MGRMPRAFTTRSTVLGLPVGRRRTDWAKIGRASMVGLSAISAVADLADGVRSAREARGPESQREDDEDEGDTGAGSGR